MRPFNPSSRKKQPEEKGQFVIFFFFYPMPSESQVPFSFWRKFQLKFYYISQLARLFQDVRNYKRLEKIGEGTYGVVYKAIFKPTQQLVALKKIKLEGETEGVPATSVREICTLKELNHPNVVELIDVILEKTRVYLVFEFLYCDLRKYMNDQSKDGKRIDKALITSYSFQLCQVNTFNFL